jgi:hypothetical protein
VEIVHPRKYRRRRGGDGGAPHDTELGRLQGNDYGKHDNDCDEGNEDLFEHSDSSPDWREVAV